MATARKGKGSRSRKKCFGGFFCFFYVLWLFERNIPRKKMRSGSSGDVIHTQDRTRWDAWGCAWKSHWEETTVSTLCLQTSILSILLFQQKLQAFTAPYWRDRRGQPAICLFHSLRSPGSWSLCCRLCGPSPLMAHFKILKYQCWELCSCLFVVHLLQLVGWIFISEMLFRNDLSTKQQLFCGRWG